VWLYIQISQVSNLVITLGFGLDNAQKIC